MTFSQTLQHVFSKAMDFIALVASAFTLPGPATKPTPQIRHQHEPAKSGGADHMQRPSEASWLESRGYRDSFAKDDEIKPDAKEDVMIND